MILPHTPILVLTDLEFPIDVGALPSLTAKAVRDFLEYKLQNIGDDVEVFSDFVISRGGDESDIRTPTPEEAELIRLAWEDANLKPPKPGHPLQASVAQELHDAFTKHVMNQDWSLSFVYCSRSSFRSFNFEVTRLDHLNLLKEMISSKLLKQKNNDSLRECPPIWDPRHVFSMAEVIEFCKALNINCTENSYESLPSKQQVFAPSNDSDIDRDLELYLRFVERGGNIEDGKVATRGGHVKKLAAEFQKDRRTIVSALNRGLATKLQRETGAFAPVRLEKIKFLKSSGRSKS
ncbi:hypothetical protein [Polaromonas naphthalenivorans]|uniref:Uncharacterized protein n=1 Tax=Polaromonas naphthalenivorans (strain CJ2) TaxID=365044 RepID=A1VW35_POLNA|nr:hypothetical protein [Polaromonas naphthalenivorans]ABM39863.1 hypothetical protein Pnap_4595 [Polaromonas naphthalenivorans CJ2]